MLALLTTTMLFAVTACAEILGCYTVYLWLKAARSRWWLVPGAASLGLFAWLLTLHRAAVPAGSMPLMAVSILPWPCSGSGPLNTNVRTIGICLVPGYVSQGWPSLCLDHEHPEPLLLLRP